jgi:hypothetical protein
MYKVINGEKIELTTEEIAQMEKQVRLATIAEKSRSFTIAEVSAMLVAQQINTLSVDDNTALRMKSFYPEWAAGNAYSAGFKVQRNGKLWRVVQAHTSQTGWEPENTASLWEQINETHSGTVEDPIPYEGNMALEKGKYYMQDYEIYLCIRNSDVPVYHALKELENLYVTVV